MMNLTVGFSIPFIYQPVKMPKLTETICRERDMTGSIDIKI